MHNGDPVLAAAVGIAQFFKAGEDNPICGTSACGNVVVIDHGNGYQTRYYHLQDDDPISQSFSIQRHVDKGEVIGKVGSTGRANPPHIHFSVVQDKNGDGDFNDNRPDGLTDPFGWLGSNDDPWPDYSFNFNGERRGNKSHYLWTKKLTKDPDKVTPQGGPFELERYRLLFPPGFTDQDLNLFMSYSPTVKPTESLESLGSTLTVEAKDQEGNPITTFNDFFTIEIDFSPFDITPYNQNTIFIYSSPNGETWTKEETQIDLINKKASAQVNHLSLFALMAEKADTVPPTTTPILIGDKGQEGWYRSNVEVSLEAEDNERGSGIYYTGYRLDDDYFSEYSGFFLVSDEGSHTIEFYSVDNDENIEEVKSFEFHIDKTHPEVKLQFDPEGYDTEIIGIDENETEIIFEESRGKLKLDLITIKDKGGNKLTLEGKFRRAAKIDSFSIENMSYNDGETFVFNKNLYLNYFSLDKRSQDLNQLWQSWFDKGETLLTIIYNSKKGESQIFKKNPGEKLIKEIEPGLVLLYLQTDNGNLEFGYQ